MKYKERDELVADLRELADFIEANGHKLPIQIYFPFHITTRFYGDEAKENMKRAALNIGRATKNYQYSDFELVRPMTYGKAELRFETSRENVCVRKVVGTKKVQKKVWVEIPNEFEDEEVVEWDCTEALLK